MERLTKRDKAGCPRLIGIDKFSLFALLATWEEDIVQTAIDRLAAYEDAMPLKRAQELAQAEKDGRLVVLPEGTASMLLAKFVDGGDNGMFFPSVEVRGASPLWRCCLMRSPR